MFPGELFSGGVIFLGFAFDQGVSKNRPKEAQLPSFQALKTARRFFLSTSFFTDLSVCVYCAKDQVTGFCFFFTLNLFLLHHPTLPQRLVLFLLEHLEH